MKTAATASWIVRLFSLAAAVGPLAAQTAAPKGAEPVVTLSVFEVVSDRDVGYQGGNTTAGSRLNTSLRDTPATIMVFTPEFISDFGLNTLEEITSYGQNFEVDVGQTTANPDPFFVSNGADVRIMIRGISASQSLDFFNTVIPVDNYNLDRIEQASGPNSILFGFGSPGGIVNVTSKKAQLARTRTSLRTQFGEWEFFRQELDHNHVLLPQRLALRLNGVVQESGGWRKWDFADVTRGAASIRYQPFAQTRLTANHEQGVIRSNVTYPVNAYDDVSLWLDSGARTKNDLQFDATQDRLVGINRNTAVQNIFVTNVDGSAPFFFATRNANNFRLLQSTYEDLNLPAEQRGGTTLVSENRMPFTQSAIGPASVRRMRFERNFLALQHNVTETLALELSYNNELSNRSTAINGGNNSTNPLRGDPNTVVPNPNGSAVPISNPNAGRLYFDATQRNNSRTTNTTRSEALRTALSWKVELGRFGTHNLAGLFERSRWRESNEGFAEILVDENNVPIGNAALPENAANLLTRRYYIDARDVNTFHLGDLAPISVPYNGRTYHSAVISSNPNTPRFNRPIDTFLAVSQSRFFNSRLVVTGGVRLDRLDFKEFLRERVSPTDPSVVARTRIANTWMFTPQIGEELSLRPATHTAGAVFHATPSFSVFYNRSSNRAQGSIGHHVLPDYARADPTEGKTQDYGFMLTLLDGKIFVRGTAYDTAQKNRTAFSLGGAAYLLPAERILDTLLANGRITAAEYQSHNANDVANVFAMNDSGGRGYELSAAFNVTKAFTGLLNFSYTENRNSNIGREAEVWFEREKTFWEKTPGAADLRTEANLTIRQEIESLPKNLERLRLVNGFGYGERPYKVNASGKYSFAEGRLKNFFLGGGVRWMSTFKLDRRIIGTANDGTSLGSPIYGEVLYGPEVFAMDGFVGYRRKVSIGRRTPQLTVQLNATNLTNDVDVIPLRYNTNQSGYLRVLLREPRKFRCTVGLDF